MSEVVPKPDPVAGSVDAHGLDLPLELSFDCHGGRFIAKAQDFPDGAVVSVEGVVGAIPFSAESPEARAMLRQVLAKRPSSAIVRLERAGRNRVMLRGEAPLGENPNRAGVVAALSAILSAGKPLIDMLVDCGARPPAGLN